MSTTLGHNLGVISTQDLGAICKDASQRKTIHLVDVSAKERFAREHIAYAFNVPLEDLEKKKESGLPPDRMVVVYGETQEEAEKGVKAYVALGFQARAYTEGIAGWRAAELPIAG